MTIWVSQFVEKQKKNLKKVIKHSLKKNGPWLCPRPRSPLRPALHFVEDLSWFSQWLFEPIFFYYLVLVPILCGSASIPIIFFGKRVTTIRTWIQKNPCFVTGLSFNASSKCNFKATTWIVIEFQLEYSREHSEFFPLN